MKPHLVTEWLNINEAAAYLGVHRTYLERRKRAGLPPTYCQVGRIVRYRKADLDDFILSGRR